MDRVALKTQVQKRIAWLAVKANIAFATIEAKFAKGEIRVEIHYRKELRRYRKAVKATIMDKPFWAPARLSATPPADF